MPDVAAILECALIRVEIDVRRDFELAEWLSLKLVEKSDRLCDQEVQVHVLQTRADALRCKNHDLEAIKVYRSAIDRQPESDAIAEVVAMHLHRLGAAEALSVTFVADGAPWIWDRIDRIIELAGLRKVATYRVLDCCHAVQHVSQKWLNR